MPSPHLEDQTSREEGGLITRAHELVDRVLVHDKIDIAGIQVDALTVEELHQRIDQIIAVGRRCHVLHVNAHAINLGIEKRWFRDFLNQAEIVFADGAGILLAARLLGHRLPQRITYADWAWQLAGHCAERGYRMYLLGARPGVAELAAKRLCERHPGLQVCGTHHGYFDRHPASVENLRLIEHINQVKPHVLLVCFGMPLQERWLRDNSNRLHVNVMLTGGAALDYVSGRTKRGPDWMTQHGFEWLARLWFEPSRLWRRYLIGNPLFVWRVLRYRWSSHR